MKIVRVLRDAAPFVDLLPGDVREQVARGCRLATELGDAPLGEFADPGRRAALATSLAAAVVDRFASTPFGSLLPALRVLDEPVSLLGVDGRLRAILRREQGFERWDLLAARSVDDLLEIRNVGEAAARSVVAIGIDRAVVAALPAALRPRRTLSGDLGELSEVLDGRGWLVLSARQVSLDDRVGPSQLARLLGVSRTRLRQIETRAACELRQAFEDPHFVDVASAARRLRELLGEGPIPVGDARAAVHAAISHGTGRLDEAEFELLLWCAGPYDLVEDALVVRGSS